jgi:hypothetical protein
MAFAARTESFFDHFFEETGIAIEGQMEERIWRAAVGQAFQSYGADSATRDRAEFSRTS